MDASILFKENYEFYIRNNEFSDKYEWAAINVFDLITYDRELYEIFVKKIIEVCKVILNEQNFEYIEDRDNYITYIIVCQLLEKFDWIDWGTSIRGAWFEEKNSSYGESKNILDKVEWTQLLVDGKWGKHEISEVPFTVDNLNAFIKFMED